MLFTTFFCFVLFLCIFDECRHFPSYRATLNLLFRDTLVTAIIFLACWKFCFNSGLMYQWELVWVCLNICPAFYIIVMLLFLAPYGYFGQPVLSLCFSVNYNLLNEKCLIQIKNWWVVVVNHLLNTWKPLIRICVLHLLKVLRCSQENTDNHSTEQNLNH